MKQKKFRRLLSVALVLVMLLSALPVVSLAVEMGTKPADGTTTGNPFPQGTGGSNSFRIPAMVTLNDGTLVAAADARWNTTYDGGGLDTIVARSSDNGANWNYTFANYLGDKGDEYNGSNSTAFIDPALATDGKTVYMLCDLYPYGVALNGRGNTAPSTAVGFNSDGTLKLAASGSSTYDCYLKDGQIYDSSNNVVSDYTVDAYFNITGNDTNSNLFFSDSPYQVVRTGYLYLTKSIDGGESWSEPTLIPDVKTSSEQVCLVGPGRGLVTSDGTIVFPVYSYNGSESSQRMGFIYSDDNGASWNRVDSSINWSSESAVVALKDGTLRFFYRNGTSRLCYVDYSWTSGWGSAENTGIATNSNTQISAISYSKTVDGKQVILVSCPTGSNNAGSADSSASARLNGRIQIGLVDSENHTMIWETPIDVTTNNSQFMYSCLTELSNGKVAILYENKESNWGTGDNSYYTMDFQTYDLDLDFGSTGSTEEEEEEEAKDTITSSGGTTTSYVLDKDVLDGGAQYLIVYKNSATASSGVAINTSMGSVNVTIDGDKAIPDGDASAALWTIISYWDTYYYLTNGSNYLYPSRSWKPGGYSYSLNCNTSQTLVSISESGGTYSIASTDWNNKGYVNYNNGWTASNSSQELYFYKYTEGTESWSVDPALQAQRIKKLTVSNDGYTTDSWNDYQSALNAAKEKLSAVKVATYASEAEANSALNELIKLVDALAAAKNNLKKTVSITVNYQAGSTIVKSETLSVAEDATSVTLSNTIVGSDGKTYDVSNATLKLDLASTKTYTVDVTERVGEEITIKENETTTISVDLEDGQTVTWSSADSSYVGVAGKYDTSTRAYTNEAILAGQNVTSSPVTVTATIKDADGNVVSTQKWLVSVTEGDADTITSSKGIYFNIDTIENCTVYYSINGGELIPVNGTGVTTGNWTGNGTYKGHFNIMFFAAPNEGYALTYMSISGSADQYYTLTNGNPDGTGSDAWPFVDANASTIPSNSNDSAWKRVNGSLHGFRWALMEDNMTIDQMKVLFSNAIALGCDGATTITKNSTEGMGSASSPTVCKFVAQKLPTVEKTIKSITHDETETTYTDGMKVELGDTINYSVVVTRYATNATYGTITYDNEKLTDELTGNAGISNPDMGTSTTSNKAYTYTTRLTLTMDNYADVVKDGKITNTAEFSYSYSSQYSAGSLTSNASAVAEITVSVPEYVIDFGLPVSINLSNKLGEARILSGTATFGTVTANGTSFTYTPNKVLTGTDHVALTLTGNQSYGVNIIPASNVLYEDGFMTPDTAGTDAVWSGGGNKGTGKTQTPGTSASDSYVYGFDPAYQSVTGASDSQYIATVTSDNCYTNDLTFTFTGTGFDLIGACGSNTGTVLVRVEDSTGKYYKGYLVDTAFNDSSVADKIYQVPLLHGQGWPYGTYTVTVMGAYIDYGTSTTMAASFGLDDDDTAVSVSAVDPISQIYALMEAAGLSEEDMDNVEFINMGRLYGAATMDADSGDAVTPRSTPSSMTVEIDGFRVYDEEGTYVGNYVEDERGVTYVNVLEAVDYNKSMAAYIEANANHTLVSRVEYEGMGGPQNEIYLAGNQSIVLNTSLREGVKVQVSARAVNGPAELNNTTEISSNTEMYYTVTTGNEGVITIANTGSGLLALGNLKLQIAGAASLLFEEVTDDTLQIASVMMLSYYEAEPEEPEDPEEPETPVFTPEKLNVSVKSLNVIRNKLVTVTVNASTDVEKLTINGQTVNPINSLLVKRGWSKEYIYVLADTVKRGESKNYEIIAYNADGTPSAAKTVTG